LSGAELNGIKGINVDFTSAILAGTEIKGSSLQGAVFDHASISSIHEVDGTDFSGASFLGAKFQHSDEFESRLLIAPQQAQATD
jgi:uncharacterized protein YjbI with pentapeptide repeats